MLNRTLEFQAWKMLAYVNRKQIVSWSKVIDHLGVTDQVMWSLVDLIQENNHIFYNPTNRKWLILTTDMRFMVTTNKQQQKEVLKSLKKKIKELKAAMKGAYYEK